MHLATSLRPASVALAAIVGSLGSIPPVSAQIPQGEWAVSAFYGGSTSCPPGPGGIYVAHPRSTTACMTPIAGLPPELTQSAVSQQGANSILIHPAGDLLVGELANLGSAVHVWRLPLQGLGIPPGTATKTQIGTVLGNAFGQVAQMHLLTPNRVLLGCSFVDDPAATPPLVSRALQVLHWNPSTGIVFSIASVTGYGALNALTYDPVSGSIYCGTWRNTAGGIVSYIHEILAGPLPFTWILPPVQRAMIANGTTITGLSLDAAGVLWATLDATNNPAQPALMSFNRTTWAATPALTSWDLHNAVAVEPATGHLALAGVQVRCQPGSPSGVHHYDTCSSTLTTLTTCLTTGAPRGGISGIACTPNPTVYGAPSGANPVAWATAGNCNGLPIAGAPWTLQANTAGAGVSWSVAYFSSTAWIPSQPVLGLGISLCIGPPWFGPFAMTPAGAVSTLTLTIPPGTCGCTLYAQSLHLAGNGIAATEGLCLTVN